MSCYDYKNPKSAKVCIGSMSHRISLQTREIVYLSGSSSYSFRTIYTVWSSIKTTDGITKFSSININDTVTHIFYIRAIDSLTYEYWINYKDNRYKIVNVEKIHEGSSQALYCKLTGDDDLDGSKS